MIKSLRSFINENRNSILGIEYHSGLCSKIWSDDHLKPGIASALIGYAMQWMEFARLPSEAIMDIVLTGSIANYNYTSLSDLDTHIIVDPDKLPFEREWGHMYILRQMGEWKKNHDTKLLGFPVEFYAQAFDEPFTAGGIYSLTKDIWLKHPENMHLDFSKRDDLVSQVQSWSDQIKNLNDLDTANQIKAQIHQMRADALTGGTEFSDGNLIFKSLRNRGDLDTLKDFITSHENIS